MGDYGSEKLLLHNCNTLNSPGIPIQGVSHAAPQKGSLLEKLYCYNFTPKEFFLWFSHNFCEDLDENKIKVNKQLGYN